MVTLKHSVFAETQRVFPFATLVLVEIDLRYDTITSNNNDVSLNIKKLSLTLKHQKVKSNP